MDLRSGQHLAAARRGLVPSIGFTLVLTIVVAACSSSPNSSFRISLGSAPPQTLPPAGELPSLGPGMPDFAPGLPTFQPGAPAPVNGTLQLFDPWQVTDPMAENQVAFRFLTPTGWQADGRVEWMPFWQRLADLQTRVSDPTTGLTVEWLPVQDFIWFQAPAGLEAPIGSNYQGKAYVPPVTDPGQFVANFWMPNRLAHLSGATLVSVVEVPAQAAEFLRLFGGPGEAHAYRLRYEFSQDGQPWEEDVSFALIFSPGEQIVSWYVNFAQTARAPRGELDRQAGVVSTIIASRLTTPEWEATYRLTQRLFTQGIQQQMADTVAFGQLLAQHRAESQALQQQIVDERQQSQDRIADLRGEILTGIGTFTVPGTGQQVQLPTGWNSYWINQQGQFAVAAPGFDPSSNGGGWQQLQPRT
jgi:hypothetical protein